MQQKQGSHNEVISDVRPLKNDYGGQPKFPMGFTTTMLNVNDQKGATLPRQTNGRAVKSLGFGENPVNDRKNNVRFMDEALAELQRMYIERQVAQKSEILLPFMMGDSNGAMSLQNLNMIERYVSDLKKPKDKDTDSDNDDEFLDTTTSMHPACVARRGSLTSNGTASTETANSLKFGKTAANCVIS